MFRGSKYRIHSGHFVELPNNNELLEFEDTFTKVAEPR